MVTVISVVVLTAVLRGVRDQILTMVPAGTYRDAGAGGPADPPTPAPTSTGTAGAAGS